MAFGVFTGTFFIIAFTLNTSFGSSLDWYSHYIDCVATPAQESECYEAIREYLSTEEGKQQAQEVGFKRRKFRDSGQVTSHAVVILSRINQMETELSNAYDKAKDANDVVRGYCLNEKNSQMFSVRKHVEQKKFELFSKASQTNPQAFEEDYQLLLSLNSRANELYLQARKCLE